MVQGSFTRDIRNTYFKSSLEGCFIKIWGISMTKVYKRYYNLTICFIVWWYNVERVTTLQYYKKHPCVGIYIDSFKGNKKQA